MEFNHIDQRTIFNCLSIHVAIKAVTNKGQGAATFNINLGTHFWRIKAKLFIILIYNRTHMNLVYHDIDKSNKYAIDITTGIYSI